MNEPLEIVVSARTLHSGIAHTVHIPLDVICGTCHGTGWMPGQVATCPDCHAKGRVPTFEGALILELVNRYAG